MRDEPKHPYHMSDIRTSKNSQAKGPHEDLPYLNQQASQDLPKIHSKSKLSGDMRVPRQGKAGRKDQYLPNVDG